MSAPDTNCPHCHTRGWVRSTQPGRLIDLCRCRAPSKRRPTGWAWGLVAFIGIVVANAIVPEAHGGTFSSAMVQDDSVLAALCGLAIGVAAIIFAACAVARDIPLDPNEPTADEQRAQAMQAARLPSAPATERVVRLADRRGGTAIESQAHSPSSLKEPT